LNIAIQIPGVRLGIVEADGVAVAPANVELVRDIDQECGRLRGKFTVESLAEAEPIVAVRAMFRGWGMDPSKYRPSSEALLRRVVQGKGLYNVSNVVDLSNLGSIENGWPYGVYNRAAISGEVYLRLGAAGEKYEGIGRRVWHLEGRPVLGDSVGPFGSPISDSTRTQVQEAVSQTLTVIYAPATASKSGVSAAAEKQAWRLEAYAGALAVRANLIEP
jgi:DNA/RNA-binding domain of Phe-tRNA-synthetase-like protein